MKRQRQKKKRKSKRQHKKLWTVGRKRKRQRGDFLNRYDFAYVRRDIVNQAAKLAPGVIKNATGNIDKMVKNRTNQVISMVGAEIERVLPKILRGAIEDVYQTPFSFLVTLGNNSPKKLKRKYYTKILLFVKILFTINQTIITF